MGGHNKPQYQQRGKRRGERSPHEPKGLTKEEAIKRVLYQELLRDLETVGRMRDEVRARLDKLPRWTPFVEVTQMLSSPTMRKLGIDDPEVELKAQELMAAGSRQTRAFQNSRYFVHLTPLPNGACTLSIRTIQNDARHDWREFQRIKNELCGADREAIELYPDEARLVDTANQFYLHVAPPGCRFPFGFEERCVILPDNGVDGSNQRAWEPGTQPPDAVKLDPRIEERLLLEAQRLVQQERKAKADGKENTEPEVHRGEVAEGPPERGPGGRLHERESGPCRSGGTGGQQGEPGEGRQGDRTDQQDRGPADEAPSGSDRPVQRNDDAPAEYGQEQRKEGGD